RADWRDPRVDISKSGYRMGSSCRTFPEKRWRVDVCQPDVAPLGTPRRYRIERATCFTHRRLHRDGSAPKRTDDTFGQACRIAFASLSQTDDFFSDRCRDGSLMISDIQPLQSAAVMPPLGPRVRQLLPTTQRKFTGSPLPRRAWACKSNRNEQPARATFRRTPPMSAYPPISTRV